MKSKLLNIIQPKKWTVLVVVYLNTINTPAQIIYTDIEPDYKSENIGDFYNLDLNNDGIIDFTLKSDDGLPYQISAEPNQETNRVNAIIGMGIELSYYVLTLPLDEGSILSSVNPNQFHPGYGIMLSSQDCSSDPDWCYILWGGKTDKYLGLRFLINGQTHYGWARLDVTSNTQWIIKDYAYNATPNEPIHTGQMVLGLEESNLQKIKAIVSNGQISILNLTNRIKFNLYTINGKKISHGDLGQGNSDINVQNLISGIYFIELSTNDSNSIITKKFIIP
ncbi:T9SS type A sorting domain-containing protein [Mariniflexile sp. HNIBRBA6329]|uniref:T9SS type A sorting domain-containing protein n=1 Tax=Mariniflexile sp. HNIBRBA6329 TaxID=3373088 RepID=UPI003746E308